MAFVTAKAFGIPSALIDRALEIQRYCDSRSPVVVEEDLNASNFINSKTDLQDCDSTRYSIERLRSVIQDEVVGDESLYPLLLYPSVNVVRSGFHPSPEAAGSSSVYILINRLCTKREKASSAMASGEYCRGCSCAVRLKNFYNASLS